MFKINQWIHIIWIDLYYLTKLILYSLKLFTCNFNFCRILLPYPHLWYKWTNVCYTKIPNNYYFRLTYIRGSQYQ